MLNRNEHQTVHIHERYRGLPGLALGGYSSGLVAAAASPAGAEVRLRRPVPLSRSLTLSGTDEGGVELRDGEMLLAEGAPAPVAIEVPAAPTPEEVSIASAHFSGFHQHPYPGCFACGHERADGDGLRVFPGTVEGRELVAAPWTPQAADDAESLALVWSAFDCAQLWALIEHGNGAPGERVVTAALSGSMHRPVRAGLPHVVAAWPIERSGNALRAGAALFGPDGELVAAGVQTAVIAKWGVPLDIAREPLAGAIGG